MNAEFFRLLGCGLFGCAIGWGIGVYILRIKNRKINKE